MARNRLVGVAKGAVDLNLRYSAAVVDLATRYLGDLGDVVRQRWQDGPVASGRPRRAPILLVGQLGERPSGAFAVSNSGDREVSVQLSVMSQAPTEDVSVEPSTLTLAPGAGAFVQVSAAITEQLDENRDYALTVLAPGIAGDGVDFVVRRLPRDKQG